jgi:hypothetical protein
MHTDLDNDLCPMIVHNWYFSDGELKKDAIVEAGKDFKSLPITRSH